MRLLMKRTLHISFILALLLVSCTPNGIIDQDDMASIYYDFYMADKYLYTPYDESIADSMMIYHPIITNYGHTFEEYSNSVKYYLTKPDRFAKIYKEVARRLETRKKYLEEILNKKLGMSRRWYLLDSLDSYGDPALNGNSYYRSLRAIFFQSDTLRVTSPTIDSVIVNHITSPFFLYDSLTVNAGKAISPTLIPKGDTKGEETPEEVQDAPLPVKSDRGWMRKMEKFSPKKL